MFELVYPSDPAPVIPVGASVRRRGPSAEMLPVIEPSGLVIGQASRAHCHGASMLLHPTVHLHLIDRQERLYIQKRALSKDLFPGRWDTAVGGHVDYGEGIREALVRETAEELRLREFNPLWLKSYVWESPHERELVNVFAAVGHFELMPDTDEISEGKWWSFPEIDAAVGKSVFTPNFEQEFRQLRDSLLALL